MAIKEDFQAIKQEIGAQEQFLENIIKSERFYKKYKLPIIVIIVAIIVFAIWYSIDDVVKQKKLISTNTSYALLKKNNNNEELKKSLKDANIKLYDTFLYELAKEQKNVDELKKLLNSSIDPLLKDIINYQLKNKSELLANIQTLLKGYEQLKQGKKEEANVTFSKISLTSQLQEIVKQLNHYQGK